MEDDSGRDNSQASNGVLEMRNPDKHKQVCTFPYALFSTPKYNRKAYPVKIDNGSNKPAHWIVFSPVHYPTHVGKHKTETSAQKEADQINAMGDFIYSPLELQDAFLYIQSLQRGEKPVIQGVSQ